MFHALNKNSFPRNQRIKASQSLKANEVPNGTSPKSSHIQNKLSNQSIKRKASPSQTHQTFQEASLYDMIFGQHPVAYL